METQILLQLQIRFPSLILRLTGVHDKGLVESICAGAKGRVGQRHMVERVLINLLTGGHVLLEGVQGSPELTPPLCLGFHGFQAAVHA